MDNPFSLTGLDNIEETQHTLDWRYFREGIEIFPLTFREDKKPASALLRYRAGASVPRHRHPGFEYIYVLHGSQQDDNGIHEKGSLLISAPESNHAVLSPEGCIVLAIWEKPVVFVD